MLGMVINHVIRCARRHVLLPLGGGFRGELHTGTQRELHQGHSHQYGWSGFNRTTFRDNTHISANILKFGGAPGRPVGSHMATVDRVEIDGCR